MSALTAVAPWGEKCLCGIALWLRCQHLRLLLIEVRNVVCLPFFWDVSINGCCSMRSGMLCSPFFQMSAFTAVAQRSEECCDMPFDWDVSIYDSCSMRSGMLCDMPVVWDVSIYDCRSMRWGCCVIKPFDWDVCIYDCRSLKWGVLCDSPFFEMPAFTTVAPWGEDVEFGHCLRCQH